jgi:hypothetical protein
MPHTTSHDAWVKSRAYIDISMRTETYNDHYPELAYRFSLLAPSYDGIAYLFGVDTRTLKSWAKDHPEFAQEISRGREDADSLVAKKLFQRATGYTGRKQVAHVINGEVIKTDLEEDIAPDTKAALAWLERRRNDWWGSKEKLDISVTDTLVADSNSLLDKIRSSGDQSETTTP